MSRGTSTALCALLAAMAPPGFAQVADQARLHPSQGAKLSVAELFAIADEALQRGDTEMAEAAYRALASDPRPQISAEARFRHGLMLAALRRFSEAARLFRRILDDQPQAQRVRLELARALDLIGDEPGARRALREVQAGGLPREVARFVDRYSEALRAQKPLGASLQVALAPDSNINRATRSDTLSTVLGDFTLDEVSKQRSGVGLEIGVQGYARLRLGDTTSLLARASGTADLYKVKAFNDLSIRAAAGPEFQLGSARAAAELGVGRRWFGGDVYSTFGTLGLSYLRPLGRISQVHATATLTLTDNHRNRLQSGRSYGVSVSYDRALSSRTGLGASLAAERQDMRDPGYSTTAGQLTFFGYRDFGAMTVIGSLGYGRLAADERLLLYPKVRRDTLCRATLGITFRQMAVGQVAPSIRFTAERNRSSIEIFDFRRTRTEFAITRAF